MAGPTDPGCRRRRGLVPADRPRAASADGVRRDAAEVLAGESALGPELCKRVGDFAQGERWCLDAGEVRDSCAEIDACLGLLGDIGLEERFRWFFGILGVPLRFLVLSARVFLIPAASPAPATQHTTMAIACRGVIPTALNTPSSCARMRHLARCAAWRISAGESSAVS